MFKERIIVLSILLSLLIFGCSSRLKEGSLTVADSLGWQENCEMNMGFFDVEYSDGKIFFYDTSHSVYVYSSEDYSFIHKIGKEGKGPGELSLNGKILVVGDNLLVSDIGSNRISTFSIEGEFLSSMKAVLPSDLYLDEGKVSFSQFYALPGCKYFNIENDSVKQRIDLSKLFDDIGIERTERENSLLKSNGKYYLAFTQYKSNIYMYDEVKNELISVENLFSDNLPTEKSYVLNIDSSDNEIFVIHTFMGNTDAKIDYKNSSSSQIKAAFEIREYLCKYDSNFNLIQFWKIPDNIYTVMNTMIVDDKFVHIQDSGSQNYYKFRLSR